MQINNDVFYDYAYILYRIYDAYAAGRNSTVEQELEKCIGEAKFGYYKKEASFYVMYNELIKRFKNSDGRLMLSTLWFIKDHTSFEEFTYCKKTINDFRQLCKDKFPLNKNADYFTSRITLNHV